MTLGLDLEKVKKYAKNSLLFRVERYVCTMSLELL